MKKLFKINVILILLILLSVCSSFGQKRGIVPFTTESQVENYKGNESVRINSYITAQGDTFSVGDIITLGYPHTGRSFDYIDLFSIQAYPLKYSFSGSKVIIKRMVTRNNHIIVTTTRPKDASVGLKTIDFKTAIARGEIISKKSKVLTRVEAFTQLKTFKEMFELGLITEEEYNIQKDRLSVYIFKQ